MRPLTNAIPKPMAPIHGNPFLDYLLKSLVDEGIQKVLILVGYKGEVIYSRYQGSISRNISIIYSDSGPNSNTGKRLVDAYDKLDDFFLLVYGDTFWPLNLKGLRDNYQSKDSEIAMTVFSNLKGTAEYGFKNNVKVDPNTMMVLKYDPTRKDSNNNGVDIGYFIVDKQVIPTSAGANLSFQNHILKPLASAGQVGAYLTDIQYYYLTDLDSLDQFGQVVTDHNIQPINI